MWHDMAMGVVIGFVLSIILLDVTIGSTVGEAFGVKHKCEAELPRNQQCKLIAIVDKSTGVENKNE